MNKNILVGLVVVGLSMTGASAVYLLVKNKTDAVSGKETAQLGNLQKEYDDLKKKYSDLETDRNNVLSQTKNLLSEKAQWAEQQELTENLKKTNKLFMAQKDKILSDNQKLKTDLATLLENFDSLKESYQELQDKQENAEKENASLRTMLTQQVQSSPEYQVLDRESKRLREENLRLGETINLLDSRIKKALERINKDQVREVSLVRQVREQKAALDQLRNQNGMLSQGNQELNQLMDQAPDKIKDMAAQNTLLLRETAQMHYNMGVFFTDNKEYVRAEKEYLRALDFDPNNTKVHYNLGYLYAEELNSPGKAVSHFEKYLQVDPNSKESESVRSYLATLSVWNQKAENSKKK